MSPSPIPQTSDEMTQGFGKLDINMESSVRSARKRNKRERPRKEGKSQETRNKANTRERK